MANFHLDSVIDATADSIVRNGRVDPTTQSAFLRNPTFCNDVIGALILFQEHYHYFVRIILPSSYERDLKALRIVQYLVYRIVADGKVEGLQRLRRFLGEQNRWNNVETKKACVSGFLQGIKLLETTQNDINTFVMDGLNDLCGLWDNSEPELWRSLARYASKKANPRLWEYVEKKAKSATRRPLEKLLHDEERAECCLNSAKSTNSRFFFDMYLNPSEKKYYDWFLSHSIEFVHSVYVAAAKNGRLKTCKEIEKVLKGTSLALTQETHKNAVFSAVMVGQRNITTEYFGQKSLIDEDIFNEVFPLLQWVAILYHRSAISYDLIRISEKDPTLEDLVVLLESKGSRQLFDDFMMADFVCEELMSNDGWNSEAGSTVLVHLTRMGKYVEVCQYLRNKVISQETLHAISQEMTPGKNLSLLYRHLLIKNKEHLQLEENVLINVISDSAQTQDNLLFFQMLPQVTPTVAEALEKHPHFAMGSIYRTAIDARKPDWACTAKWTVNI